MYFFHVIYDLFLNHQESFKSDILPTFGTCPSHEKSNILLKTICLLTEKELEPHQLILSPEKFQAVFLIECVSVIQSCSTLMCFHGCQPTRFISP